jgi:hypothetical protein
MAIACETLCSGPMTAFFWCKVNCNHQSFINMKRLFLALFILSLPKMAIAALPPQYQNVKDVEVMVNYVKANPDVAATLKSIDLENKTVNYGKDCQVTFERKPSTKPVGMVGPAEPLQLKAKTCPGK